MAFFATFWKAITLMGNWLIGIVRTIKQAVLREKTNNSITDLENAKTSDEEDLALKNLRRTIYEEDPVTPEVIPPIVPQTLPPEVAPNEISIPKAPNVIPPSDTPK